MSSSVSKGKRVILGTDVGMACAAQTFQKSQTNAGLQHTATENVKGITQNETEIVNRPKPTM